MHLSIASKLTLAILSVTLVVLAATLLLARWSFEQGFLDYVNALERERLELLVPEISQVYERSGGDWETIQATPLLREIERSKNRLHQPAVIPGSRPPGERGPPPHLRKDGGDIQGKAEEKNRTKNHRPTYEPPRIDQRADSKNFRRSTGKPPLRRPPPHGPHGHIPPTGLYDANGNHISGILRSDASQPIEVSVFLRTELIGTLISSPKRHLNDPTESQFAVQQTQASLWIALFAVLLALAVSSFLARRMLNPVHRIHQAVDLLARGHYELPINTTQASRDELGQLQANIQNLARVLTENQSVRKRWLADISHELRTPITIMLGELEAVSAGLRAMDETQIASLTDEAARLNKIVEDLYELALSDIGGLRYQYIQTDIVSLINEVVASLNTSQSQVEISIHFHESIPSIEGDPARLRHLLLQHAAPRLAAGEEGSRADPDHAAPLGTRARHHRDAVHRRGDHRTAARLREGVAEWHGPRLRAR